MWTRAPSITSCVDCLALVHKEEVGAASPRFHHRGSSNHQPGERELKQLLQRTQPTAAATALKPESAAAALDRFLTLGSESTTLHHDLPKPPGTSKRSLPRGMPFFTETSLDYYPMSTPERASIVAMLLRPATGTSYSYDVVGCVRKEKQKPQLDDMRTQIILANAHTPASSDQEVPEVVLPSPSSSKRRRLVYDHETELNRPPAAEAGSPEGCEDSGLTGEEQHMADLDRTCKGRTPEDIDSETAAAAAAPITELLARARNQWELAPEQEHVVDPVLPEPLQIFERLHFSSTQLVPGRTISSPRDDDSHFTTSQFLPPAGHIRVPISDTTRTMASGRDEWLQLSLGSRPGGQSDDEPLAPVLYQQNSTLNPRSTTPDPPGIRDFFKFGAETQEASSSLASASPFRPGQSAHSGPHYFGESSKQHFNSPRSEPRSAGVLSRPLFVEPQPRATTRDFDPYVHISRVLPDQLKSSSFTPQQFSNLSSSPYHAVRVLQPVRSEQTDTTAVHAWRSSAHEAGPSSGPSSGPSYNYAPSSSASWMQQRQDTQRTSLNPAEFLTMGTRDWRSGTSFASMQPPMGHGVDPEQSWRNLLQRVGSTPTNVPVGTSMSSAVPRHPESMTLMPTEEYLDALKRAVERFQGADQGGKEEPLAELQRLHRSATVFPPPRHHPAGLPFDSSPDIGLARLPTALGSSKPRAQAAGPGPSSESRQKRILRPHALRPGLWFTLLASNSQPEASPLQQIPTAYIRVVDDTMTVAVVRRYLANKLGMASEDEVELTCKGQPLPPSLSLHQVRDAIWQSANINTPNPNTPQLLSEGKAWKAPDGSITLVGDVIMVITYSRRPQQQQAPPPPTSA